MPDAIWTYALGIVLSQRWTAGLGGAVTASATESPPQALHPHPGEEDVMDSLVEFEVLREWMQVTATGLEHHPSDPAAVPATTA
jgi:hypothetical protein